ncbi:hypothetical protein AYO20_05530 [Fonsecaea nubica]|uniref:Uncharacterized protein n=1 Tax=Fonsecaea nubica TaxID=856822 RepID=A0A178D0M0_9EURO|nr:hypothetical protein AYO20_05530 [Fonsecaea nubica]OAL35276.1 hypothetical protein AYO20_05530 [Fonsecaea nubica]
MELPWTETELVNESQPANPPAVLDTRTLMDENHQLVNRVRFLEEQLAQRNQRAQLTVQHISQSLSNLSRALQIVSADAQTSGIPSNGDALVDLLGDFTGMNQPVGGKSTTCRLALRLLTAVIKYQT